MCLTMCLATFLSACYAPSMPGGPAEAAVEEGEAFEQKNDKEPEARTVSGFRDFGDPNFGFLIQKMRSLEDKTAPEGTVLRIVQFGDSHTASDTITSGLRQLLQQRLGDAGVGWIAPAKAQGQSHRLVRYETNGWELGTSRGASEDWQKVFPMGGYIATPIADKATISVIPKIESADLWEIRLSLRQWKAPLMLTDAKERRVVIKAPRPFGIWRDVRVDVPLRLPITITAISRGDADLGGIWLEKHKSSGVTVSPVGLNGIMLKNWEYWSMPHQWTWQLADSQADMVILAYGTNEAVRPDLDIAEMKGILRESVRIVREALPESVLVIVGAPDALLARESIDCGERLLPMLNEVKKVQQKIAEETQALFWDWQAAMGGPCRMDDWVAQGLAKADRVHFSLAGYQRSAEIFYSDLMTLIGARARDQ
jgi:lysophospholipase L1-like esterase